MKKHLIIIVGMSGSGKSTILHSLKKQYGFNHIPQWTTRPKRSNEDNNGDYIFSTEKEMKNLEKLTWFTAPTVFGVWHYFYTKEQFENNPNKINILVTDLASADKLKKLLSDEYKCHIIFLNPPVKEIERRLVNRGDNPSEINRRIESDLRDLQYAHKQADLEVTLTRPEYVSILIDSYLRFEGVL